MHRYILRRLFLMVPVLFGVTFIVFFILSLTPGNPAAMILGEGATAENIAALEEEMGLNDPLLLRYARFIGRAVQGDLGTSYRNALPVMPMVLERFPATCLLAVASIFIALLIGIPTGILSAKRQYTALDYSMTVLALIGVSMPVFWLGLLLVMIFSLKLGWLPSQNLDLSSALSIIKSLVLPAVTLGAMSAATTMRMTRSSMLEVIRQDYIATARAKGLSERAVTFRHMISNALIPIITAVGLQFGMLLGGSMLTETIFSWPGLGRLMVDSIKAKDIPLVLGSVLFLAIMFSVVNLLVDIIYSFVDPRIKSQFSQS